MRTIMILGPVVAVFLVLATFGCMNRMNQADFQRDRLRAQQRAARRQLVAAQRRTSTLIVHYELLPPDEDRPADPVQRYDPVPAAEFAPGGNLNQAGSSAA